MKDNAKAELETIVEMAMEWCKENDKDYLSVMYWGECGIASLSTEDADYKMFNIVKHNKM